jgi:hypothetical protein
MPLNPIHPRRSKKKLCSEPSAVSGGVASSSYRESSRPSASGDDALKACFAGGMQPARSDFVRLLGVFPHRPEASQPLEHYTRAQPVADHLFHRPSLPFGRSLFWSLLAELTWRGIQFEQTSGNITHRDR